MYVGRIVAVGQCGAPLVAYRVSSRSFPNRVARITGSGVVSIQPLDPEDLRRSPYIAYNCVRVWPGGAVVSNGTHTDPIIDRLENGEAPDVALRAVLEEMGYERDEHCTPRIAGVVTTDEGFIGVARADGVEVQGFALRDGFCRFICTYERSRVEAVDHPFLADTAAAAARYVIDGGVFSDFELPVCSAAWRGELAVCNPHAATPE